MKGNLHPRNKHQGRYHFEILAEKFPDLKTFLSYNRHQEISIDFANPKAVKVLNQALLITIYGLKFWDIPDQFLCPPIPNRADYIHYLADLIGTPRPDNPVHVLDIGSGANCIYPLLGYLEYNWNVVGTESNPVSYQAAKTILDQNSIPPTKIEIRLQPDPTKIFHHMIQPGEFYHATLCNPPFHASAEEAAGVNLKKWRNLGKAAVTNFGGQHSELWCPGGEVAFVSQMIEESAHYKNQCRWFTSLLSKKTSLNPIYDFLRKRKVNEWKTIEMEQGQKKGRFVAWTFLQEDR